MELFETKKVFNKDLINKLVFIEHETFGMKDHYFVTNVSGEEIRLVDRYGNGRKLNLEDIKSSLDSILIKVTSLEDEFYHYKISCENLESKLSEIKSILNLTQHGTLEEVCRRYMAAEERILKIIDRPL
jgi:hypothetical protein